MDILRVTQDLSTVICVTLTVPVVCALQEEDGRPVEKEKEVMSKDSGPGLSEDLNHDGFYFPSVDLLTAQVQNPEFSRTCCAQPSCASPSCCCMCAK